MPNTIPLGDWLQVIDAEYLSSFVCNGGASVKFAVTPDELKADLYTACKDSFARNWTISLFSWTPRT